VHGTCNHDGTVQKIIKILANACAVLMLACVYSRRPSEAGRGCSVCALRGSVAAGKRHQHFNVFFFYLPRKAPADRLQQFVARCCAAKASIAEVSKDAHWKMCEACCYSLNA
jgi:hypothetical protein